MSRYWRKVLRQLSIHILVLGCVVTYVGAKMQSQNNAARTIPVVVGSLVAIFGVVAVVGVWYLSRRLGMGFWYLGPREGMPSNDQHLAAVPVPHQQPPTPNLPRPGWYADPSGARAQRYWDGTRWGPITRP